MREVDKETFYAYMGPRDVHPRPFPDFTLWVDRQGRTIGRSTPGYLGEGPATFQVIAT